MVKFRNAQSYYGNTAEARRRQRANLIPGNSWQKRRISEMRLDCWWETTYLREMRDIYEHYENDRGIGDTPKGELKSEKELIKWWSELTIDNRKFIRKTIMTGITEKCKADTFRCVELCLKEKLALSEKGL